MASVSTVTTISRYLQDGGGNFLRPILVLLASQLVGGVSDGAVRMAAVVEMIHAATLVHGDVIDVAKNAPRGSILKGHPGAIIRACWRATGCKCRRFRWRCASATSMCWIC